MNLLKTIKFRQDRAMANVLADYLRYCAMMWIRAHIVRMMEAVVYHHRITTFNQLVHDRLVHLYAFDRFDWIKFHVILCFKFLDSTTKMPWKLHAKHFIRSL